MEWSILVICCDFLVFDFKLLLTEDIYINHLNIMERVFSNRFHISLLLKRFLFIIKQF